MPRRNHRAPGGAVLAIGLVLLAACTSLPALEPGTCGNGIVEPELGEDCDRDDPTQCGAPDTEGACRRLCATADDCPADAVCGLSGTCAVPSGEFAFRQELPWTTATLLVGDVDGDGAPDLVGVNDVAVDLRRGDGTGAFAAASLRPTLPLRGSPVFTDVTGDGIDDLTLSVGLGANVVTSGASGAFGPTLQPSAPVGAISAPLATAALPASIGGFPAGVIAIAARLPQGPDCPLAIGCDVLLVGDGANQVRALPARLERLAGPRLPWTEVARVGGARRFMLAVAYADDLLMAGNQSQLALYPVTVDETTTSLGAPVAVAVPGFLITARFGDFNGDGDVDLLTAHRATALGPARFGFAAGDGQGGFAPVLDLAIETSDPAGAPVPLAWFDFNEDGALELVAATGVWRLQCGVVPGTCVAQRLGAPTAPWADAAAADVDGDGRLDLIGQRQSGATVDLLLGTGFLGVWNDAAFDAAAQVQALRVGDLDGNGLPDLALITASGADGSELSVAFGQLLAAPTAPVAMGSVGEVTAIEPIAFPAPSRLDLVEDLLIGGDREGTLSLSVVFGSPTRRMLAPFLPSTPPTDNAALTGPIYQFTELEALAGLETNGQPGSELAAIASVWGIRDRTTPEDRQVTERLRLELRRYSADASGELSEAVVGEVPVGLEEVDFTTSRWVTVPAAGAAPARVIAAERRGRIFGLPISGCPGACAPGAIEVLFVAPADLRAVDLRVVDLDGEGALDVVALHIPERGTSVGGTARIWRGGTGVAEVIDFAPGVRPIAVDGLRTQRGGRAQLVFAVAAAEGGGGLLISTPGADGRYEAPSLLVLDAREASVAGAGTGVVARDVNRDGLDDLVVTYGDTAASVRAARIYLQARVPGGAGLTAVGEGS